MKAIKENKSYIIDEKEKTYYLAQGYNLVDDKGNIVEYSKKATVSYTEYETLKNKYDKLKSETSKKK